MDQEVDIAKSKRRKPQFGAISSDKKQKIMDDRKAENTNKATKLWVDLFVAFLKEKHYPEIDDIPTLDLADIIEDFYLALRSKRKLEEKEAQKSYSAGAKSISKTVPVPEDDDEDCMYSNSTIKKRSVQP